MTLIDFVEDLLECGTPQDTNITIAEFGAEQNFVKTTSLKEVKRLCYTSLENQSKELNYNFSTKLGHYLVAQYGHLGNINSGLDYLNSPTVITVINPVEISST